jgi:lipoprotein-releasing system permease protein
MSFESFVSRRYLRVKHQRKLVPLITILATMGVAVGVMVLVVVIAVMTGFQSELKRRILGIEAHMLVMRYSGWIQNHRQMTDKIEALAGVQAATPFVYAQGMLRSAKGVSGLVLRGIDPQHTAVQVQVKGGKTLAQTLAADSQRADTGVVLGAVVAEKLKLQVGDTALLMVLGSRQGDTQRLPQMHRLIIVGLFDTGMHQYDGSLGFVEMRKLQQLLGVGDLATGIEIRLQDPDAVVPMGEKIREITGIDFWINHWKQMHRNLFSMLALQKMMMYVILTLIIVVAAFNIASALIMMVKDKTKDIAILKTMGATNRSVQKIFLGKGVVIGVVGVCIGAAAGLLVCLVLARYPFIELPGDVYFLTTLPVQIKAIDMAVIVLGTLVICVAASYYPAKQAAKKNPVEGIRFG